VGQVLGAARSAAVLHAGQQHIQPVKQVRPLVLLRHVLLQRVPPARHVGLARRRRARACVATAAAASAGPLAASPQGLRKQVAKVEGGCCAAGCCRQASTRSISRRAAVGARGRPHEAAQRGGHLLLHLLPRPSIRHIKRTQHLSGDARHLGNAARAGHAPQHGLHEGGRVHPRSMLLLLLLLRLGGRILLHQM
jgi:hypothetical protein